MKASTIQEKATELDLRRMGWTTRQLRQARDQGVPCEQVGRERLYNLPALLEWSLRKRTQAAG